MAPPMAAEALGRPPFAIADLVHELRWPHDRVEVGLVETAGGVRSPLAADGDCLALCGVLEPDLVVLVADAGLGTINAVRLTVEALVGVRAPVVVVLNRFDAADGLHERNLEWLRRARRAPRVHPAWGRPGTGRPRSRLIRLRGDGTGGIHHPRRAHAETSTQRRPRRDVHAETSTQRRPRKDSSLSGSLPATVTSELGTQPR